MRFSGTDGTSKTYVNYDYSLAFLRVLLFALVMVNCVVSLGHCTRVEVFAGEMSAGYPESDWLDQLEIILEQHGDDPAALVRLGSDFWRQGRGYEAETVLTLALREERRLDSSSTAQARATLNEIYANAQVFDIMQGRGNYPAQERYLTHRIETAPRQSALNYVWRGFARRNMYLLDEALSDFITAQTMGIPDLQLKGEVQQAVWLIRQSLANAAKAPGEPGDNEDAEEPDPTLAAQHALFMHDIYKNITELAQKENWVGIDAYLGTIMEHTPLRAQVALQRGYLRIALGNHEDADKDLTLALQLNDASIRKDALRGLYWIKRLLPEHGEVPEEIASGVFGFLDNPVDMLRLPAVVWLRAADKLYLADSLRSRGEWDGLALVMAQMPRYPMRDHERVKFLYCRGELEWARGERETAYADLREAYTLTDRNLFQRANICLRFAEYHMNKGDTTEGVRWAREAVETSPQSDWIHQRAGSFLLRLGETENGLAFLQKALELAQTPARRASVYGALVEAYERLEQPDKIAEYSERFNAEVAAMEPPVPPQLQGLVLFYQARAHEARGDNEAAVESYERASRLIDDPARLADTFMKLAELAAARGDRDKAIEYAEQSFMQVPFEEWKVRQVESFYARLRQAERAITREWREDGAAQSDDPLLSLSSQADFYIRSGDEAVVADYARRFIEAAQHSGRELSDKEEGLLAYFRGEALFKEGKIAEAFTEYESAIELLEDSNLLADVLMKMARHAADASEANDAAGYAGRSAAMLPDSLWKQREVSAFMTGLGMLDEAAVYTEKADALSAAGEHGATTYASLADSFKRIGNHRKYLENARLYLEAITTGDQPPTSAEKGLAAFYRAEILAYEGYPDRAAQVYEEALLDTEDPSRLADIHMNLAELKLKGGHPELAAENARKAAALLPDRVGMLRRVGDFMVELELPEDGEHYLLRAVELASSPDRDAATYGTLAQAYKDADNQEKYLEYAQAYVQAITEKTGTLTRWEEGMLSYYQAELASADGREAEAYGGYEHASSLILEKYRLADVFAKMAAYEINNGLPDLAARHMAQSVEQLPREPWKLQQAASFFLRADMLDEAVEHYQRLLRLNPPHQYAVSAYGGLSEAFRKQGNEEKRLEYLKLQTEAVSARESATDEEEGLKAFHMARLFAAMGHPQRADEEYRRAAGLVRDNENLSEIYFAMAGFRELASEVGEAAEYARKSASLLPGDATAQQRVGLFLVRLDFPDEAVGYFDRALAESGDDAQLKIAGYGALADGFKKNSNPDKFMEYAERYSEAIFAGDREPSDTENGRWLGYQADLAALDGDEGTAFEMRRQASGLITEASRLDGLYIDMVRYLTQSGRKEEAVEYIERSVALMHDLPWKLRQAGDQYARLDMTGKALEYYGRSLDKAPSPLDRAASYKGLAEIYRRIRDEGMYAFYVEKYIDTLDAILDRRAQTREDLGLLHYYRGELHRIRNEPAAAYREYTEAASLLRDINRLSDAYLNIARHHAEYDTDPARAEAAMDKSVSFLPREPWKLLQAGDFFNRLGLTDKALDYYRRTLERSTLRLNAAAAYRAMAEIYRRRGDEEQFIEYAEKYLALFDDSGEEPLPSDEDRATAAFFRAEMHTIRQDATLAYQEYETVARLSTEPRRLSEAYYRIAQYHRSQEDMERAAEAMEQSAAQLPDQPWKLRQAGSFFQGLSMPDRALSYYTKALELSTLPADRASSYRALAEFHKKQDDNEQFASNARAYLEALSLRGTELSADEFASMHYYRAELHLIEEQPDLALGEYEKALTNTADPAQMSDIYLKMAELHASRDEASDRERAIQYAVKAAEAVPAQSSVQRRVGVFFGQLGEMFPKQLHYYERALAVAKNARERAAAYGSLADAHKRNQDSPKGKHLEYARLYMETAVEIGPAASNWEKGLSAYYQGEILTDMEMPDQAYLAYERASTLIEEKYRRTDALLNMARYNAENDNPDLAASQALEIADLLPEAGYRVVQAARILSSIKRYHEALAILTRAIQANPEANWDLYRSVAETHSSLNDRKTAAFYNARYIDYVTEKVAAADSNTEKLWDELWEARRRQVRLTRSKWRYESYLWGSRKKTGDENLGTKHELYRPFSLTNGMYGKVYVALGWTLYGNYSGYYVSDFDNSMRQWSSNPRFKDSLHVTFGANIHPFPKNKWLRPLSVGVEYVRGLSRNDAKDLRFRLKFERTEGMSPRQEDCRRWWLYEKDEFEGVYSVDEDRDFTASGTVRRGVVLPAGWDKNCYIAPYGAVQGYFEGFRPSDKQKFGLEAGPGVLIRKHFREDKYHTPRAYVELALYYRWGLTRDRKNTLGFTLTTSF